MTTACPGPKSTSLTPLLLPDPMPPSRILSLPCSNLEDETRACPGPVTTCSKPTFPGPMPPFPHAWPTRSLHFPFYAPSCRKLEDDPSLPRPQEHKLDEFYDIAEDPYYPLQIPPLELGVLLWFALAALVSGGALYLWHFEGHWVSSPGEGCGGGAPVRLHACMHACA